ncbi:MAG TPA: chemotaxis protein CheC [Gemmataceae bacterium]|jgi:chemotaxis protein CheC|nr:chemotaxis protein CheC [Gemmataceae bacterium]
MKSAGLFSAAQLDYLVEMFNIGAGNAATALNHLLQCEVNMKLPGVNVVPAAQATSSVGDPGEPIACLRMRMVGELTGCLFFIVPDDQKAKLAELAEQSMLGPKRDNPDPDRVLAALAEIGNILAGVYLTAIHDFCKLNVSHSVPVLAIDMLQALLDESIATQAGEGQTLILVTNEFIIGKEQFRTFFLIFPNRKSITALVDSMKEAARLYGYEKD